MNLPIISLEIHGMKNTIKVALTEQAALMDKHLNEALEKMCTEESVAGIVEQEARRQIELALKEEVQNFFRWSSNGRAAVREAVHEHLSRMYPAQEDQQ
ncbi:MAG: hypothetical protein ACOVPA_20390 [Rubrivivax sp.]